MGSGSCTHKTFCSKFGQADTNWTGTEEQQGTVFILN